MKQLYQTFIDLPTRDGILLIAAAVVLVTVVALLVARVAFRAGERSAEARLLHFSTKRRELASIR
jgi:hypothetical protein